MDGNHGFKEDGARVFNLGGTVTRLARFKSGFGGRQDALLAASFCPRSNVDREIHTALRTVWGWIKR
jgi:hypothetical protein